MDPFCASTAFPNLYSGPLSAFFTSIWKNKQKHAANPPAKKN